MARDRDDILRKVQGLINKAESTTFGPERDSLLEKADQLMTVYAISRFELGQRDEAQRERAEKSESFEIIGSNNPVRDALLDLSSAVANHCRCKLVWHGASSPKKYSVRMTLVGFPADIAYAQMLYTSLYLQLAQEMEPKADPELEYIENLVMLKETGMKWQRIHEQLVEAGIMEPEEWAHKIGVKFTNDYTRYCKETNRPRQYTQPLTYQRNFAQGFVGRIEHRFWEMKRNQREASEGNTMAIVLRDINKEVNEAFEDLFPDLKALKRRDDSKFDYSARNAGDAAGKRARIEGKNKVETPNRKALS